MLPITVMRIAVSLIYGRTSVAALVHHGVDTSLICGHACLAVCSRHRSLCLRVSHSVATNILHTGMFFYQTLLSF
jgi:hypothetical protein